MKKIILAVLALFVLVTAFTKISEQSTKGSQKANREYDTYIYYVNTDDWLEMDIFSSLVYRYPEEYKFVTSSKPIYSWYEKPFHWWREAWQKNFTKCLGIFLVTACTCILLLLYFRNKDFIKMKSKKEVEAVSAIAGTLLMVGLLVFAYVVSQSTTDHFYMTATGAKIQKIYPVYVGVSAQYIIWGLCGMLASVTAFVLIAGKREETAGAYIAANLVCAAFLFLFWI